MFDFGYNHLTKESKSKVASWVEVLNCERKIILNWSFNQSSTAKTSKEPKIWFKKMFLFKIEIQRTRQKGLF